MRNLIITMSMILLIQLLSEVGASALAQNSERGTTLVCTGRADGFVVEEWTPEQVGQSEPQRAHPKTGDCRDPGGLWVGIGWTDQYSWLCSLAADSRWSGPYWVNVHFRFGEQAPPDPETGRCSQPWGPGDPTLDETGLAAATAAHMTELEVAEDYDRLYAWMHPDSKAIVPQSAVEGWYREVFAVWPPVWMTIDDVRLIEWTWEVTGKVYPSAAEVAFRQRFADGQEIEGVTHLVRDNGVWRWFFGADRAFVDEQIARSPGSRPEVNEGTSSPSATLPAADTPRSVTYTILDLGTGDGNWSSASHINERGQVLWAWATTEDPMNDRVATHPMLWWNGTATDLAPLDIDYGIAINDTGTVLAGVLGELSRQDVLCQPDSGTVTPVVAFNVGSAVDLNNAGDLIGWVNGTTAIAAHGSVETVPIPRGFTLLEPAAINDAGHVVGTASENPMSPLNQRAVLVADGLVTVLPAAPGAESSSAGDLNDVGQVVGNAPLAGMHRMHQYGRAFLYDHATGTTTDMGTLPGYQNSVASAINNVGQVVGSAWLPEDWRPENDTDRFRQAFVYDHRAGKMSDLNQLIPQDGGWYLVDAFDVNDAGQIVGRGLLGGEMHAFLLTPTLRAAAAIVPTPTVNPTATSSLAATATTIPTLTVLPTPTPAPTATPAPAPTAIAASMPLSPSPTVAQAAMDCQLVELYPGYPGYRGYVAGIDGPGEVACLGELVAANPGFDRATEDAANLAAARAIGLAGPPKDWTWENWMAVEAERGLTATCYSCLFRDLGPLPQRTSAAWDQADPRLRMGGYGTSEAIAQAAAEADLGPNASAFFLEKFDPIDQDGLGPDHVLRAFVGLNWPGDHTAPEMIDAYGELFALLGDEGTTFFDSGLMWETVLAQGGYAPTPPTASIEDQLYMVRTSLEAMCYTGPPETCDWFLGIWYDGVIEPGYLNAIGASGRVVSLRAWLREEFGNPLTDQG